MDTDREARRLQMLGDIMKLEVMKNEQEVRLLSLWKGEHHSLDLSTTVEATTKVLEALIKEYNKRYKEAQYLKHVI